MLAMLQYVTNTFKNFAVMKVFITFLTTNKIFG